MKILGIGLVGVLAFAFGSSSASAHDSGVPALQGRWEFAVLSGDSPSQLSKVGQTTFSTYLLQSGTALTNVVPFTLDGSECDQISFNNITVSNSSVDRHGHVVIVFNVGNGGSASQIPFQYVFTGSLRKPEDDDHERRHKVITGTYQKTAGGCTQGSLGTSHPDGTFAATFFPDFDGQWAGTLDDGNPANGTAGVPALFSLKTLDDHSVSGTLNAHGLQSAGGVACFASTVTLTSGQNGGSFASGVLALFLGQDSVGTQFVATALSVNPDGSPAAVGEDNPANGRDGTSNDGTNRELSVSYEIIGGPCDGVAVDNQPFSQVHKNHHGEMHSMQAKKSAAHMSTAKH